jgi:hypothetical protein
MGASAWARYTETRIRRLCLVVLAATAALIGQLWLRYRCPTHDAGLHLLVFHVAWVLFISAAGALAVYCSGQREA